MWKTLNKFLTENLGYYLGAAGFLHELVIQNAERPFLLTASLALMGYPLVYKAEKRLRANGSLPKPKNGEVDKGKE